jgi:DNA-binding GntR family transcriptional regulator
MEAAMSTRRDAVRQAVAAYWRKHGHAPSITDLEDATGIGRAWVHQALMDLTHDGTVRMRPGVPRTAVLTTDAQVIADALQRTPVPA